MTLNVWCKWAFLVSEAQAKKHRKLGHFIRPNIMHVKACLTAFYERPFSGVESGLSESMKKVIWPEGDLSESLLCDKDF